MPIRRAIDRKRSPPMAQPSTLQLLDQVSFELSAAKKSKSDISYALAITHRASATKWTQAPRAFEDFHQFQQRLLKKLHQGHVCTADCAFLYTFVKSYFPKPVFFGASSSCLMEKRRESLALCLRKLQQFLLERANHGCGIIVNDIAKEVADFVVGDVRRSDHPLHDVVHASSLPSSNDSFLSSTTSRASSDSILSTSSEDDLTATEDVCPCVCSICNSSLDVEAFSNATSPSSKPKQRPASSSSSSSSRSLAASVCSSLSYTTTLGCGHQFHDECIVPKLNENMQCPTCGHHELADRLH
ncbi:hypothetical protein Gpo141_00013780 [Globisporangium polare]